MKHFCSVLWDLTCEGGALTKNPAHKCLLSAVMGTLIECVFMPVCNLERRLLKQADTINSLQLATGALTSAINKMLFSHVYQGWNVGGGFQRQAGQSGACQRSLTNSQTNVTQNIGWFCAFSFSRKITKETNSNCSLGKHESKQRCESITSEISTWTFLIKMIWAAIYSYFILFIHTLFMYLFIYSYVFLFINLFMFINLFSCFHLKNFIQFIILYNYLIKYVTNHFTFN